MKFIILHGDDTENSYKRLSAFIKEAKKRGWDIVNDNIEETPSLFGTGKLIIIRDNKILNEKSINLAKNLPGTLVVYSDKKIPAAFLRSLPTETKKELYEMPFLLWKFLDTFNINTFQEVLKTQPVEMVFAMMARRMRDLYWVKTGNPKMNSWQLSKLKKQSSKFSGSDLAVMIDELANIDVKSKTGGPTLKDSLDIFIVKRLG